MTSNRSTRALALGCASLVALLGAAPSPSDVTAGPGYPAGALSQLGTTKFYAENDGDVLVGGVQIFVAAGLDREASNQSGVAALVAESILRTPVDGLALRDAIAAHGGSIAYTVDGRSVHYYLESRSGTLAQTVGLLGRAFAKPDFSPATLAVGRAALATRIGQFESNALNVGIQMFRRSYYASNVGAPALGSAASLANLDSDAVRAFFTANYKRSAVTASAVGAADPALGSAVGALAGALPDGSVASPAVAAKTLPTGATRIIAHRDIGAPWVVVGYAAPSPGTPDFGPMLVMQSLLSAAFERDSATSLGFVEKSVGALYLYDSSPASLIVYVNGTLVDPTLALRELLLVSRSLASKPIGASQLAGYKTQAKGQFLNNSVTLSDRSYLLGTFGEQGLGPDSMNAALAALDATSASDLQRIAKQYLQRYIVALVLPRQQPAAPGRGS